MSIRVNLYKDKLERLKFKKSEILKLKLKYFNKQFTLNKLNKQFLFYKFCKELKYNRYFFKYKNKCLFTARARSVFTYFRLSRMQFKNFASYGYLVGVNKASW